MSSHMDRELQQKGSTHWNPVSTSRVEGPSWRVMETGHQSTRAINLGSGNQVWLLQLRTETSMIGWICGLHSKTGRKMQSWVNCWYLNIRTSSVINLQCHLVTPIIKQVSATTKVENSRFLSMQVGMAANNWQSMHTDRWKVIRNVAPILVYIKLQFLDDSSWRYNIPDTLPTMGITHSITGFSETWANIGLQELHNCLLQWYKWQCHQ